MKRDEAVEDLKNHVEMAHLLPIRLAENATKKLEANAATILAEAKKLEQENIATRLANNPDDKIYTRFIPYK